jgi:ssRNA-specific RNase YbeY (16S rRNA maturation enzyme)
MRLTELFQLETAIVKLTESANREATLSANTQRFLKRQLNESTKAASKPTNVINFPSKNR